MFIAILLAIARKLTQLQCLCLCVFLCLCIFVSVSLCFFFSFSLHVFIVTYNPVFLSLQYRISVEVINTERDCSEGDDLKEEK